jgi:hypothetical protein
MGVVRGQSPPEWIACSQSDFLRFGPNKPMQRSSTHHIDYEVAAGRLEKRKLASPKGKARFEFRYKDRAQHGRFWKRFQEGQGSGG